MSAEQLDVVIEQGATFGQLWQILNKDLTAATYSFEAKFRTSHAATSTVLTLTSTPSPSVTLIVTKSGNHTHLTADVPFATTAALTAPSSGVYDIEYVNSATGIKVRAFEGSYYITPEATR